MYKNSKRPGQRNRNNFRSNNRNRRPQRRKFNAGKQYIDPRKFIKSAKPREEVAHTPDHKFTEFDLGEKIQANIKRKGFEKPSPIQDQTIKSMLDGKDVIGLADTGTGKTAAFALPILRKLSLDGQNRALIIAPTRELAQQIEKEFRDFSINMNTKSAVLIGGQPMHKQIRQLKSRPNYIVGTPGRIKDHMNKNNLDLSWFNILVLDEVDRMLDMGFLPDIKEILSNLKSPRQSLFFSATLDKKIESLVHSFMLDPIRVSVKNGSSTSDNVDQDVLHYQDSKEKIDKLHNTLIGEADQNKFRKTLIFEETRRSVDRLNKELSSRGFKTDIIHGGKTQGQRQRALRKFKENEVEVLVATDVAARGIDIVDITHVINYSLPQTYDDYTHRIGRAGRAGRTGQALTFVKR